MIYFTSDPHGEMTEAISRYISDYREGDLLIILGDVGLKFEDTEENRRFTERFLSIDKPILIVEGNHENHAYLNAFPEEEYCGGIANRLSPHIVRLKRGHIFTVEGKTFFVMGGCKSSAKWKEMGLWFDGEEPTEEELLLGYESLRSHDNRVDYILTHKYQPEATGDDPMTLEGLWNYINRSVTFRHWYAGHWHRPIIYDEKHSVVYNTLTPLA